MEINNCQGGKKREDVCPDSCYKSTGNVSEDLRKISRRTGNRSPGISKYLYWKQPEY